MAEILKVNGNTLAPSEQIGRDVLFVTFVAGNAVLNTAVSVGGSVTNLDLIRQVVDSHASITMVGTNSTSAVAFMIEGHGFAGPGSPTLQAELNEIRDQVEALNGAALGTTVCTFSQLENDTLVVLLTDT